MIVPSDNVLQKIELYPAKAASQRTQLLKILDVENFFYKLPTSENSEAFGKHMSFLLWFFFL